MTGHSRGGALANIVSARLIDKYQYDKSVDVFGYTFAAPATTVDRHAHWSMYDSIFNIVNSDDFITYFPLSQWGFTRYGKTTEQTSVRRLCESEWNSRTKKTYQHMSTPQSTFDEFYKVADSREACYSHRFGGYVIDDALVVNVYPANTISYYYIDVTSIDGMKVKIYQSPMFFIKCFVAVAAEESNFDGVTFTLLDFAPYLELTEIALFLQILDSNLIPHFKRIYHPHCPESYCILTEYLKVSDFK